MVEIVVHYSLYDSAAVINGHSNEHLRKIVRFHPHCICMIVVQLMMVEKIMHN